MDSKTGLPAGWKWVRLGEVCEIFSGTSAPQDEKYFENGRYPFVRVSDLGAIGRTTNLIEVKDYINELCLKELNMVKASKGTILFPKSGAAITTNNRAILGIDAFIVSHLAAVKPKENIAETHFVYYWLYLTDMVQYMDNMGYPSLKLSTISSIQIPLPPLSEQKRIAAKLQEMMSEIDQARTACEKQLEAAKSLSPAYLREVFESSEAKKWQKKKLGEVIKSTQSGTWGDEPFEAPKEEVYIVIRSTEIDHKGVISIKDEKVAQRRVKPETARKYFLKPNDLLIVRSGGTTGKIILGRVGIYLGEPNKYLFSNFLLKVQADENLVLPEFLWRYLNWDKFLEDNIPNLMRRTTGIQNLPMDEYFSVYIPLPSLSEQKRIAVYLKEKIDKADKLRASIEKELETINSLPQSILSKAFSRGL